MKFRTEIPSLSYPFSISHDHKIMLLGSCFSDNIGNFFQNYGFNCCSNPFGTLFNPISIATDIEISINPTLFSEKYIDFFNKKWISYAHHGRFSHSDRNIFEQQIHNSFAETHQFLSHCNYLFITFGTAYCYRLIDRDFVVANCHKIPAQKFDKFCLTVEQIVNTYQSTLQQLQTFNPNLKVIFTVSPVRHLGDGFHENQISKSTLHLAINQLVDNQNIFYFPSYEIVQDDLRDYRFYAADLCHPSESAVQYIWEILTNTFCESKTQEQMKLAEKENKAKNHRSNNPW